MKILALESASLTASAALLEDGMLLAQYTSNFKKTHSQTLLPMVDEIMRMTETEPIELGAVAVSQGPGSFTGLRIGAAAAKAVAFALSVPVAGVPTTDAMAYGCFGSAYLLCPILDARRDQVYTGLYEWRDGEFLVHREASALSIAEQVAFSEKISKETGKQIIYLGDGLSAFTDRITELSETIPVFAPGHVRYQNAASVGALGYRMILEGKGLSSEEFAPVYLRKSQAEREREAMGLPLE